FRPVAAGLYVDAERVALAEEVGLDGVRAHVRIHGVRERESLAGSGRLGDVQVHRLPPEHRRVVVDVHDLQLDVEDPDWVLQDHVHLQEARGGLTHADALPVDLLADHQVSRLFVDVEVVLALDHVELRRPLLQAADLQSEIRGQVSDHRARRHLLRDGVAGDGRGGGG
uniref:Uncharacterized protein n=1 Tax=Gadus morhua TaxID=8049 RepID=A0A8C5AJM7_GADMO